MQLDIVELMVSSFHFESIENENGIRSFYIRKVVMWTEADGRVMVTCKRVASDCIIRITSGSLKCNVTTLLLVK